MWVICSAPERCSCRKIPFIEAEKEKSGVSKPRAKVLLATVKGDVHDIGKNIVGVVLACNNFEIIDLGVMVSCEQILETAKKENVDIIGLSGLITPSLDEMVHNAAEMERLEFKLPLLIGGATTSRVHTAVKIEPHYSGPTMHVLDASRSVPVVNSLINEKQRQLFVDDVRGEYGKVREDHNRRQESKTYLTLEQARANKVKIDWEKTPITVPKSQGTTNLNEYPLEEIRDYIDWTPFFITWELHGKFPQIFEDRKVGEEARKLYDDAQKLLDRIISEKLLKANGVLGLFPANSVEDDIEVYTDEKRDKVLTVFHTLRQQTQKTGGNPNRALADYLAPKEAGIKDYIGAFAITAGIGIENLVEQFETEHDDYNSIMVKALADRLAEAFAELLHEKIRKELWGYSSDESLRNEDLIKEKYSGIRPAPGYPACPDHTEKQILWDLISAEKNTGISLTENFAMYPAASVSGLYFAHPEATYFSVGKIGKDQVADYQKRKGLNLKNVEKWLRSNLNY